ncbi:TPA: DUF445 family protein, partial [Streptococcus suis]|nr:DUF445 family protein [Streptococcus suis]
TSELSESLTSESTTSEETPQQVLEQVVSDAEILIQIANGHTTPSQELTDAVAVSTKDIAAAKLILGNTKATAEEIQTVVDSVQNSSQALGALLIKDDEDSIITFALDTTTTLDSTFDTGLVPDSASASLDDSRIVLEQNISEARVLMQMVSRQATSGNETLSSLLTNLSTTVAQSQQLLDTPTATQEVIANQTELLRTDVLVLASEYQKASLSDYIFTNLAVTTDSTQAYIDSNGKTQYIYSGTLTGGDASENANNTIIDSISYSYDTGTNRTTWKVDLSPAFATNNQFGIVIATNDSIISREMTYYSDGNLIRNSDYTPYISKSSFDNLVYNNYAINITEWRTIGGGVANNMTWTFVTEGDSKTFYVRTATAIVQSTLEGILKGDGRTLYAQRYDESPLKGIDIDSLDPRPGSQSVSESTSKSESISNSESLSNSESTSNSESLSNSISESVRESVSESISESVRESVVESLSESVRESVVESLSESVRESVVESLSESVRESVVESLSESVRESVVESLSESVRESIVESLSESVSESISESISESVSESISESVSESISESVSESISESVSESISESVSESISESTSESISESVSESISESVSESISESVSESISESTSESISESVSESISESVSESISESVSESISESVSESISESTSESISESVSESISESVS